MKRSILFVLITLLLVALIGCDRGEGLTDPTQAPTGNPTDAPTGAPTDAPTDVPTDAPTDAPIDLPTDTPTHAPTTDEPSAPSLTVDEIVDVFEADESFSIQWYSDDMIAQIAGSLQLEGEITAIVHIIRSNGDGTNEWAYIYEMSNQSDADWLAENRALYVTTVENGVCIQSGKIVVFGNSDVIRSLTNR